MKFIAFYQNTELFLILQPDKTPRVQQHAAQQMRRLCIGCTALQGGARCRLMPVRTLRRASADHRGIGVLGADTRRVGEYEGGEQSQSEPSTFSLNITYRCSGLEIGQLE